MELKPSRHDLVETIHNLEQSSKTAFALVGDFVYEGPIYSESCYKITHIDMFGPNRWYAKPTKGQHNYQGPIWTSEINLFCPDPSQEFFDLEVAVANTLGISSWERNSAVPVLRRYDFRAEQQPKRDDGVDVVPHVITFRLIRPDETDYEKKQMVTEL